MAPASARARPVEPTAGSGRPGARLSRLLLLIALASAAVYCVFWSLWTWNRLGDERDRARVTVQRNADAAAQKVAEFVGGQGEAAGNAASALELAGGEAACTPLQAQVPRSATGQPLVRYDLVRPDGTVVCTTAKRGPAAVKDGGAPWLAPGYVPGTHTADYTDPTSGRPVWAAAVPVDGGSGGGLLGAVIELEPVSSEIGGLLLDSSGTEFMLWNPSTGSVLSRPAGTSWGPDDQDGRIVVSKPIPGAPWRLAGGIKRSTVDAVVWSEARGAALALLAAMGALALAAALVHRRIVRPLEAVTSAARDATTGGTTSLPATGPAEVAQLATALNELTAERARSEQLLRSSAQDLAHSLERLDAVLANCADMVLIVGTDGRIAFASPSVVAVCGPSARPGVLFGSLVHPEDGPAAAALIRPDPERSDATAELRMGGGAAGWRHVEVVARDLSSEAAVAGVVLNGRDVTDRLAEAAHRAALDEQLHQSQRLESLGALAGGIAHDFKNLLSVIVWSADMADAEPTRATLEKDLGEIRAAATRGIDLAEQLLAFSRRETTCPEPLDVGAELLSLAEMLRRTMGTDVALDLRLHPGLPAVRVDRSRFHQAVVNLAVNARDAMPAGGRLTIEAAEQDVGQDAGLEPGRYVVVTATDNGSGMTAEVASRAVEPFFTTKPPGSGTGLGLSIVHGVVSNAGGAVRIDSAPGRGTIVRLFLPASADVRPAASKPGDSAPVSGDGQVVLVVEDDPAVRSLVERMLREGGYAPVGAAGPAVALELAARPDVRIDVVLTDLLMPAMSGADLAARFRRVRPDLPVVFMSAYSGDVLHELVDGGAEATVLEKPFTPRQLLDAIHAALSAAGAAAVQAREPR